MVTYFSKKASITGAFLIYGFLFWQASATATETVRVRQVVDGDSLRLVDGRKVRLIGINTPELARDGKPDEPLAVRARDALKKIVAGRALTLKLGPDKKDRYGRTLAYVILPDGSFAGEKLLQTGLASMIAVPPNIEHLQFYQQAEASARRQRIGIWAHPWFRPVAAESLDNTRTGYRFVAGQINRVGKSRKYYYFDLTRDFSIAIKRNHWHHFGGNPDRWRGRKIVVRGWISRSRDKLRMRIDHPAMIEVIN
ncbi:MAG: thermonuclease family protein [Acidiferrobacterales bacterium]